MSRIDKKQLFSKENILILALCLVVAVIALCFIYMNTLSVSTEQLPAMVPLTDIAQGDLYSQEILCTEDGLTGIRILFATFARENKGTVTVTFSDLEGNLIQSWQRDASSFMDNTYVDFNLDEKIEDSADKRYIIGITSDSVIGESITIYTTNYGGSSGLDYNGSPLNCSVCFRLSYDRPASALLTPKIVLITILMLLLLPAMMFTACRFFPKDKILLLVFPELAAIIGCHRIIRSAMFAVFPAWFMAVVFLSFCLLWLFCAVIFYRLIYVKKISVQKLAVIVLSIFSAFTIVFLTPGTVNDEQYHYAFAYKYSNAMTFTDMPLLGHNENKTLIRMRPSDAELLSSISNVPVYITEVSYKNVIKNFNLIEPDNTYCEYDINDLANIGSFRHNNVPLAYIASGAGIALGRTLHLGTMPTFYLGRIFNAALFILLVYLAIKIIPVGKETLFVISLFPMLLQLAASYSYDSIILGLMFLFTAKLISVFYSDKKVTKKQLIAFAVLAVAIAISKYVYAPVILCLLVIPSDKIDVKKPKLLKGIVVACLALCTITAVAVLQNSISVLDYLVPSYSTAEDQSVFNVIVSYIGMFAMTMIEIMDFYIRSLVAYPGWYQIYVPTSIISAYYLLLIFSTVRNTGDKKYLSTGTKIWFAVFMGMSCILMTFPMAAKFTSLGSETIEGIQGRYFLPLVPLFCLGFRMKLVNADSAFFKKILWGGAYISFLFFGFCFLDLFSAI
ncbi:MAG: DUF2142 domain-containing protein [Saccharofermentans sp.]|nr:DUF2142 domain-containing protein [Saccharofermentans sp.]